MTVHLFGTRSSPGCSNFAPKRTAKDGEEEFGERAAETLKRNFYVDDALKSVPTEKDAIEPYKLLRGCVPREDLTSQSSSATGER